MTQVSDNTRHLARHPKTGEPFLLPADQIRRVVLCSGQIYYALSNARRAKRIRDVVFVRLEQIAPFPHDLLVKVIQACSNQHCHICPGCSSVSFALHRAPISIDTSSNTSTSCQMYGLGLTYSAWTEVSHLAHMGGKDCRSAKFRQLVFDSGLLKAHLIPCHAHPQIAILPDTAYQGTGVSAHSLCTVWEPRAPSASSLIALSITAYALSAAIPGFPWPSMRCHRFWTCR